MNEDMYNHHDEMHQDMDANEALKPTNQVIPTPHALIFSLQFYLDHVRFLEPWKTTENRPTLVVGFQLLQFEIVFFDTATFTSNGTMLNIQQGKSCLFEMDPEALEAAVTYRNDDSCPPISLFLLEQPAQCMRAFATVDISELSPSYSSEAFGCKRFGIAEWAVRSGQWELRNHSNQCVGVAVGTFTLACLGKALAPHIKRAIASSLSPSPSAPVVETEEEDLPNPPPSPPSPRKQQPSSLRPLKQDIGIQCERQEQEPFQRLIHIDGRRAMRSKEDDKTRRPRRPPNQEVSSCLQRELPPPLFFHKPKPKK